MRTTLLSIALLTLTGLVLPSALAAQTKIYIDPGHGGNDPGAVNSTFGTQEDDRVLFTSLAFRDYLLQDTANASGGGNWEVRLSRTTDTTVGLTARATDANTWGAARFLSIHQNAFNQSANGTETFSASLNATSVGFQLSTLVQEEAIIAWNRVNRGTKQGNFTVLTATNMPAILTEMGFVDSPTDHPFCVSDVQCQRYALGMLYAVQRHFGFARFDPTPPPELTLIVDNDNGAPGYTETGTWGTSTGAGFFGATSRFSTVQNQTNVAKWTPTISEAGEYEVSAWWVAGTNRSNQVTYTVRDRFGSTNVLVNQEINGGQWNVLGTFSFQTGTGGFVTLNTALASDEGVSGTVASADSIRFVKKSNLVNRPTKSLFMVY